MKKTYHIGLDVHKETVAIAWAGPKGEPEFYGKCAASNLSVERTLRRLGQLWAYFRLIFDGCLLLFAAWGLRRWVGNHQGNARLQAVEILVLDEATSQLDPVGTADLFAIVRELNRARGMTIVMATDQGEQVAEFCDRVLVLHQGELVADGTPREVFADDDLLARVVIRAPQVSRLAAYLAQGGRPLPHVPITLPEAVRGIEWLLEGPQEP